MARASFLAFLAAISAGFAAGDYVQHPLQASITNSPTWKQCGDPKTDPLEIKAIEISPDPPQRGADLTVTVVGEARETIEDHAYADVLVKVGVLQILRREYDICEEARKANASISCPVESGLYVVEHTVALPKEIPKALFNVHVDGFTAEDDPLVCLDISIDFR